MSQAQVMNLLERQAAHEMGGAYIGGRKPSKGIRHCTEEVIEPSGVRRCAKYAAGPRGAALIGGRRSKGIRHCVEEVMEPSGLRRCAKYAAGPRGAALIGGARFGGCMSCGGATFGGCGMCACTPHHEEYEGMGGARGYAKGATHCIAKKANKAGTFSCAKRAPGAPQGHTVLADLPFLTPEQSAVMASSRAKRSHHLPSLEVVTPAGFAYRCPEIGNCYPKWRSAFSSWYHSNFGARPHRDTLKEEWQLFKNELMAMEPEQAAAEIAAL